MAIHQLPTQQSNQPVSEVSHHSDHGLFTQVVVVLTIAVWVFVYDLLPQWAYL